MSIVDLYLDYNVDTANEGHRHYRDGWMNVECPFCTGNPGYHLGFNLNNHYYFCFRCGPHFVDTSLGLILKKSKRDVDKLILNYKILKSTRRRDPAVSIKKSVFQLPTDVGPLDWHHKHYLEKRNFDPDKLKKEWDLMGTGPTSHLDNTPYKFRILAPIYWDGSMVSFQTRDYTNKQTQKYLTCSKEREQIFHKDILYGSQVNWGITGICVEGITDVWRMGPRAFATFGIVFSDQQVRQISRTFERVYIVYDPEPQAQAQAEKLQSELKFRGVEAWNVLIDTDPADMSQDLADSMMNYLLTKKYSLQ